MMSKAAGCCFQRHGFLISPGRFRPVYPCQPQQGGVGQPCVERSTSSSLSSSSRLSSCLSSTFSTTTTPISSSRRLTKFDDGDNKLRCRRRRQYVGKVSPWGNMPPDYYDKRRYLLDSYRMDPHQLRAGGKGAPAAWEEYLSKASLSPWAPLPDSAARKIFDLARASPTDVHVDLGCGDGRVCFHAIDYGKVQSSVGIDIDEQLVEEAITRMSKRHPQPTNLRFVAGDLMNLDSPAWDVALPPDDNFRTTTTMLLTMNFARPALEIFRPVLEAKLAGWRCKVVTCGYEMPGWDSTAYEVVLGTQLHLYDWGSALDTQGDGNDGSNDGSDQSELWNFPHSEYESLLTDKPSSLTQKALESERFRGAKIIDRTRDRFKNVFNTKSFYDDKLDIFALKDEEDDDEDHDVEVRNESNEATSNPPR